METKIRRSITSPIEFRADDNVEQKGSYIQGYSAVFGTIYQMFEGYTETIAKGAFDDCDMSDVVCLYNHDDEELPLGRTTSKTLELSVDDKGLYFKNLMPDTQRGKDVATSISRGDISGCSFAFTVKEQIITDNADGSCLRTITKIGKLYDVGPVMFPAYIETDVEVEEYKRSINGAKPIEQSKINPQYFTELEFNLKNK